MKRIFISATCWRRYESEIPLIDPMQNVGPAAYALPCSSSLRSWRLCGRYSCPAARIYNPKNILGFPAKAQRRKEENSRKALPRPRQMISSRFHDIRMRSHRVSRQTLLAADERRSTPIERNPFLSALICVHLRPKSLFSVPELRLNPIPRCSKYTG